MGRKADKRIDLKMPEGALQTYKRLLGYLRPHKGMFAVGVVGMTIFAATDAGWAAFVKFFLDGTFVDKDPRMVWLVPVALVIALSRMVLGLHYPTDVIAGGLLGAGIAAATLNWVGA